MKKLIDAAHAKGMKVFFDIITNHTADVIDYDRGHSTRYIDKATAPYKDASGDAVRRPRLRRRRRPSRRWTRRPRSRTRRSSAPRRTRPSRCPAWLNDPTLLPQPRRLDLRRREQPSTATSSAWTTCSPSSPKVVDGHGGHLQDLGRLRHRRLPDRHRQAREHGVLAAVLAGDAGARRASAGNDDFFMFGEVYDASPAFMSTYTTDRASCRPRSTSASRAARAAFAAGQGRRPAARPVRRRRLLHRHRLQRLRAADVPRQPRHGPDRR